MNKRILWIGLLVLAACQPIQSASIPTPKIIHASLTPSLEWMGTYFNACAIQTGGLAVIIDFKSAGFTEIAADEFTFLWGPAGETFSTKARFSAQIGWDDLVFISHPQNPIPPLPLADLQGFFSGSLKSWKNPSSGKSYPVHLYVYPQNDDVEQILINFVGEPARPTTTVAIVPDPEAMRTAVAGDPNGLGYIPHRWLDNSVKEIQIQAAEPRRLHYAIITLAQSEPQGIARKWLYCLQQMMK